MPAKAPKYRATPSSSQAAPMFRHMFLSHSIENFSKVLSFISFFCRFRSIRFSRLMKYCSLCAIWLLVLKKQQFCRPIFSKTEMIVCCGAPTRRTRLWCSKTGVKSIVESASRNHSGLHSIKTSVFEGYSFANAAAP